MNYLENEDMAEMQGKLASHRTLTDLSLGKSKTLWTLLGGVREDIAARMNFDANYVFIARLPRCQWRDRS